MIPNKKILFIFTSFVLFTNCISKSSELPIFVGGLGKFNDIDSVGYKDGKGIEVRFWNPYDLTIDKDGNLYVVDSGRIRKVTTEGVVNTFAGSGENESADGKGINAKFRAPKSIDIDSRGNLFVGDETPSSIRKITPEGEVITLKIKTQKSSVDKELIDFAYYPTTIAIDKNDFIYVVFKNKFYRIKDEIAEIIKNKDGKDIELNDGDEIFDIAVDSKNNLYVIHQYASFYKRITKISPNGEFINFLDNIYPGMRSEILTNTTGITLDDKDNIYFGDPATSLPMDNKLAGSNSIYKVSPDGKKTIIYESTNLSKELKMIFDNKRKYLYLLKY